MTRKGKLIPISTTRAAERGFIRTAAQTLAASIPVSTITGAALAEASLIVVGWSILASLLTAGLAGAASYASILADGIPEEYATHQDTPVNPARPSSDG